LEQGMKAAPAGPDAWCKPSQATDRRWSNTPVTAPRPLRRSTHITDKISPTQPNNTGKVLPGTPPSHAVLGLPSTLHC
jgi:hypothetical protein